MSYSLFATSFIKWDWANLIGQRGFWVFAIFCTLRHPFDKWGHVSSCLSRKYGITLKSWAEEYENKHFYGVMMSWIEFL